MPLLLSEEDVRIVLSMDDLIAAMRPALEQFSVRAVQQPLRTVLEVGLQKAAFAVMPALIAEPPALGAKLVTVFASNAGAGLPTHLATILLFDSMTGELMAIMDGRYITEARYGCGIGGRDGAAGERGRRSPRGDWIRSAGAQPR